MINSGRKIRMRLVRKSLWPLITMRMLLWPPLINGPKSYKRRLASILENLISLERIHEHNPSRNPRKLNSHKLNESLVKSETGQSQKSLDWGFGREQKRNFIGLTSHISQKQVRLLAESKWIRIRKNERPHSLDERRRYVRLMRPFSSFSLFDWQGQKSSLRLLFIRLWDLVSHILCKQKTFGRCE